MLKYVKLSPKAITPTRSSSCAAGYDLHSAFDYIVPAKGKALIKTDIALQIPDNCYGRIAPRSGLAWKHFIHVGAGVIDSDYRENICVLLFNFEDKDFIIKPGDRIAQIIFQRVEYPQFVECSIDGTERGEGGSGSTGVN